MPHSCLTISGMRLKHRRLKKALREPPAQPSLGSSLGTECENTFLHEVVLNPDIQNIIREQIEEKFQQSKVNGHYKFPRKPSAPSARARLVPRPGSVSPHLPKNQRHTRQVSATKLSRIKTAAHKKPLRPTTCSKTPSYRRLMPASPYGGTPQRHQRTISIKRTSPYQPPAVRRARHVHSFSAGTLA